MNSAVTFESHPLLDALLDEWRDALDLNHAAYRNHVHRIYHLTRALRGRTDETEDRLIAIAAVFHDIGIWSHKTLDYLDPSAALASAWLDDHGWSSAAPVVRDMILNHHKLRRAGPSRDLVEAFRRADWLDVSQGLLTFDLPKGVYAGIKKQFPYLGFHTLLLKLGSRQTLRHPLNPLPMMRW